MTFSSISLQKAIATSLFLFLSLSLLLLSEKNGSRLVVHGFTMEGRYGLRPYQQKVRPGTNGFVVATSSFVPTLTRNSQQRGHQQQRKKKSSSLNMMINRMSNECVQAIKAAHDIGNEIGLQTLRNEIIFVGIITHPERAAKTLRKFNLDNIDEVKATAIRTLQFMPGIEFKDNSDDMYDDDGLKKALPFSDESKLVLSKATQIADKMESKTVRSEHVLLALLGYNNGEKIDTVPVLEVLADISSLRGSGSDTFSVTKFCDELVNSLPNIPVPDDDENDIVVQNNVVAVDRAGGPGGGYSNILNEVGVDLTQLALDGKLDMVFGREKELRMALRTLGRRRKNNPCLIGDPGVGKTAIAEALAQVLANGLRELQGGTTTNDEEGSSNRNPIKKLFNRGGGENKKNNDGGDEDTTGEVFYELPPCPAALMGSRIVSVELASLVAGTGNRGDFEKKVKNLIKDAIANNVILFIDEVHNLLGTGGDGAMNAANLLKPALARGELRILGATTTPEYRRYIEKDGALERRFQPLLVKEPTVFETLDILAAISPKYEEFHGVEYTYNALLSAAKLSNRYISDRFLPDKAIDLIDEAGSMTKMADDGEEAFYVTEDTIGGVISEITGIPLGKLDTGEKSRLQSLEQDIEQRIKGQTPAVRAVAKAIRRSRSGMRDGKRPVASMLFCGPTGVGKTELCKALAETYYGQEKDMIRIDMSEYMDRFSTSRLIGAPPGYVGYEEGGQLTEAVRRAPHSVILLDELEKAHDDVLNLLLQIMDEGKLTDGKGRTVSFKNNILVMTSNVGSKEIMEAVKGSDATDADAKRLTVDVVKKVLEDAMRPELLNRIDEIISFSPLSFDNLKAIAKNLVNDTVKRAKDDQSITLTVSDDIPEIVTRQAMGTSSIYGARPVRRAIQRFLEDTMAEAIMADFIQEGDEVNVSLKDPNSTDGKKIVEIKRKIDGKSIQINVDDDAGISKDDLDLQSTYGDLPRLDGPPKQDPGAFQ